MKLFKASEDRKWEAQQEKNWAPEFQWEKDGSTTFQTNLIQKILAIFPDNVFQWHRKDSEVRFDEINRNGILIELTSQKTGSIRIWIYWNMADFKVNGSHLIFEHWDYLDPTEYAKDLTDRLEKEIKTATNNE